MPTIEIPFVVGGHAEPVIGRAFARPGGFAHPTIERYRALVLLPAPNIGIWLTASTTEKVMISIEMPNTAIAARSPLSLRS